MSNLDFKLNKLGLNQFDFILNSVANLYGNSELFKCLYDDNDPRKLELAFSQCTSTIIDELVHSKHQHANPFVRFFLNSVKSFHNLEICSTKTLVCFTILLWRQIQYNFLKQEESNSLDGLSKRIFSKHLTIVFEEVINKFVKNNEKYVHFVKSKLHNVSNSSLINGLCRNKKIYGDLMTNTLMKYDEYNKQGLRFSLEHFLIIIASSSSLSSDVREIEEFPSGRTEFNYNIEYGLCIQLNSLNYTLVQEYKIDG